ncbi:MAG: hypothetical protein HYS12_22025 [Planctomycetes bacterium]|nr:hypothetical protein [Planctomycetota bacterium]
MSTHPLVHPGMATIHHSQLPDLSPDNPLFREWRAYRRELPRLLQEGLERKFGLFKGDDLLGLFESEEEATDAGSKRALQQPFMVHPIVEHEPVVRFPVYHYLFPLITSV